MLSMLQGLAILINQYQRLGLLLYNHHIFVAKPSTLDRIETSVKLKV
jgi:hypothetical protein